jgi:putative acetyltransferase
MDSDDPPTLVLREARESDVPDLARIYAASIRELGPEYYSPEGIEAWAASAEETRFRDFVLGPHTLVAEDASGPVGFAGMEKTGRIASLFVRPDRARQGVGSQLLEALLRRPEAPTRLWTQASELSRPLFEKFGFTLVETEVVERRGAELVRYVMERRGGGRGL